MTKEDFIASLGEPWASKMKQIISESAEGVSKEEIQRRNALMFKGAVFGGYGLNLIFQEARSCWPDDECIIPSLRPKFLKEIIDIEAMCYEPEIDGEVLEDKVLALYKDYMEDLKYVKETEDFLDDYASSKY